MPREVLGYHGTTREGAAAILLAGKSMRLSRNRWDWLGDGVYFWEYGPYRAAEWAQKRHGEEAVVLRARIVLEGCLDLVDLRGTRKLKPAYAMFSARMAEAGIALPRQKAGLHGLDRAVINAFAEKVDPPVRVVRAPFIEGERLWPGSELWEKAHVQIAVRDVTLIEEISRVESIEDERL